METFLAYLPFLDMAGLSLAMLLIWQANRLNKQVNYYSKKANKSSQQLSQHVNQV